MNRKMSETVKLRNVAMAKQCLVRIRDIAERGAASWDPEHVGYALQELSQVFLERTGIEDRIFEPLHAGELSGLSELLEELRWVEMFSESMAVSDRS